MLCREIEVYILELLSWFEILLLLLHKMAQLEWPHICIFVYLMDLPEGGGEGEGFSFSS